MPEFEPGSSHIAKAIMTNPTSKAFDYLAELYMGTDLALMASTNFHLEAGESKEISLPITMPSAAGTYPVYIGVFSAGENIALYRAVEDAIIIISVVAWEFSNVSCSVGPSGIGAWKQVNFEATVTNIGGSTATRTLTQYRRDYRLMWSDVTMSWYWIWTNWRVIRRITLTLTAGQSYNYASPPNDLIESPCTAQCYLIDSDGYKSEVCQAVS